MGTPENRPEAAIPDETMDLLKLPDKWLRRLFTYLNPVDCFNLAHCSPLTLLLVRHHSNHQLSQIHLRFDAERSCVGAYFEHLTHLACVFYSWTIDPMATAGNRDNRTFWTSTYELKSHKFSSHMFHYRTHPKPVQLLQQRDLIAEEGPIDWLGGMMDTYYSLAAVFPKKQSAPYVQVGVNASDKASCQCFASSGIKQLNCIRLIGHRATTSKRVREVLKPIISYDSVRVAYYIGPNCLHPKVTNATFITLDDPEWITREQLLNLNCLTIDIGHNQLSAADLNAFLRQWMFDEKVAVRCERLEVQLSPEAFDEKTAILEGLPVRDWHPANREGEHFEPARYITPTRIRDPTHFLDCKQGKDLIRRDGRLATVQFHAKKMHFVVWRNRFPYLTLKRARKRRAEEAAKAALLRRLHEAMAELRRREQAAWDRRLDAFEAEYTARKDAEAEEHAAKRKYFEALREFMDTSASRPKRRVLRTITIFKEEIP